MGALVETMDQCRVGISDAWHYAGELVGLL